MEVEGKIIMDLPLEEGISRAGNAWKKKSWVLETFGMYPKKVKFDVFGDRADSLKFELMQDYVVSVDLESREFNGRWYTDVRAFAMRPYQAGETPQGNYPNQTSNYQQPVAPQGPQFGAAPQPDYVQSQMPDIPQSSSDEELPF